jgi:hypothetical protein
MLEKPKQDIRSNTGDGRNFKMNICLNATFYPI